MDVQIRNQDIVYPPPLGPAEIERWTGSRPIRRQNRPHQMMAHRTKGGWPNTAPIFWAPYDSSSVANLVEDITINGVTVSPSLRYEAKDATATTWAAVNGHGPTLTLSSSGTSPTLGRDTPLISSSDMAALFLGGKAYQASATDSAAEIDLEDFVLEVYLAWCPTAAAATQTICGVQATPGAASTGWSLCATTSGTSTSALVRLSNGASVLGPSPTIASAVTYSLLHVCVDRSDATGIRTFINGVASSTANPSAFVANSLISGQKFTIGASADLSATYKCNGQEVIYVALYKRSGWFAGGATNATQQLAFARDRTAYLAGTYPIVPWGAGINFQTRSTSAFSDKIDPDTGIRKMFYCGPNWPRLCYRKEISGGEYRSGFLSEQANLVPFLHTGDLQDAAWVRTNLAAPTTSTDSVWYSSYVSTAVPIPLERSWNIIADATLGVHGLSQTTAVTTGLPNWVQSVFAKAADKTWLNVLNSTDGKGATFDLANGSVGTITGAGVTAGIENWGDGWYRCWILYTPAATPAVQEFRAATDTNDTAYSGDGTTVSILMLLPQTAQRLTQTVGTGPTTPIVTIGAGVTRATDRLEYSLNAVTFPLTLEVEVLNNANMTAANTRNGLLAVLSATSGGSFGTDAVSLRAVNAANYPGNGGVAVGGVTTASITGTTNVLNGEVNKLAISAITNNVKYACNNVQEGATDVSAAMPSLATPFLEVGNDQPAAQFSNPSYALISNLKIFPVLMF